MDLNEIQSLIRFVSKSGVSEVELETKDFKINIKTGSKESGEGHQVITLPANYIAQPAVAPVPAAAAAPAAAPVAAEPAKPAPAAQENANLVTIKSPMIGTFYRSANPESDAFVNVGTAVSPGKVLCIIEAMKLFNEIECEVTGKIVKILVDDASPVEYDQPLFLVDPS